MTQDSLWLKGAREPVKWAMIGSLGWSPSPCSAPP